MNLEEFLKKLKSSYIAIDPPISLRERGWLELRKNLAERAKENPEPFFSWANVFGRRWPPAWALATATGLLLLVGPPAQASLPGDFFYPAKRFVENLFTTISPNKVGQAQRRAQEVIDLSARAKGNLQSKGSLEKTVEEYKWAVSEASREVEVKAERKEEFKKELSAQKEGFRKIIRKDQGAEKSPVQSQPNPEKRESESGPVADALREAEKALQKISSEGPPKSEIHDLEKPLEGNNQKLNPEKESTLPLTVPRPISVP